MKIKKQFENIWKIKLMQGCKQKDKEIYYDIFTLGYGCALIDVEDSQKEYKEK